ncbi:MULTISPECIES: PAS domain-containing sensor histidine kinase [unclassified Caulobacter]|uniref:hybrid sensor histidine kinase/response regulator n=1 Tax=unclassified Caulobacter TaxID=2648921 RepID=UPI0009E8FCC7|nr:MULTISPECIES: PAS domain-containing sensor histidine kinase [unclassified Caulobacter]
MSSVAPPNDLSLELLVDGLTGYGIYMLDAEGRVATWNTGAQTLKGYTTEEILGEPFSRFFTPEDRRDGLPQALMAKAASQGKAESQGWRVRKDGGRFWCSATLQALRNEAGEIIGYAKITRDMTAEREAQQALIESERRFRYLVEGVVDYAIYMLDPSGVIINWNRGAERIKGYQADDIVGRHFGLFYTPEDRQRGGPARALKAAEEHGRFEGEGWRLRKDGSRFWASVVIDAIFDDEGRHLGYAKITRDISERKAAEEALAQSERQFRLLVDGVVDYALYMLDPNGIITNWNAGAERIKGYTADEIVGQHVSRFYTPADRAAGRPLHGLHQAATTGRFESEGWRVRKDGSRFWANVVIDAIRDEDGALVGFAKITRDITEKREAEAELQKTREHMAKSQKMEALGQLTGGVAHDFNNLLMVVGGQAQLLRAKLRDDERALRALDAIEISAQRGQDLTRHLLSFARRQRLQTTIAPFSERLAGVRELVSTSLPPNVQLLVDASSDLWPVEVDQGELDLALLNLAVNARDAMPGGGVLSISAENVVLTPTDDLGPVGEYVAVHIVDTGGGIPPDILERVFEPFFTTKEVGRGTGLGLSQVYGFAQQAGGDVKIDSRLGEGTRFSIYLPRSHGERAAPATSEFAASESVAGAILLVEDNPDVADVAAAFLQQLGHRVKVATSAGAALNALENGEAPDLVFSDIVMAGDVDGLGMARVLRERYPQLPVLLATGYSHAAERIGDEFPILRKPYNVDQLGRAITALLNPPSDANGKLVRIDDARRARAAGSGEGG